MPGIEPRKWALGWPSVRDWQVWEMRRMRMGCASVWDMKFCAFGIIGFRREIGHFECGVCLERRKVSRLLSKEADVPSTPQTFGHHGGGRGEQMERLGRTSDPGLVAKR